MQEIREVTEMQWRKAKRMGHTAMLDGKPHILTLDTATGATVLERVHIDKRHQGWVQRRRSLAAYKVQQASKK